MTSTHDEALRWLARATAWEAILARLRSEARGQVPAGPDQHGKAVEPGEPDLVPIDNQPAHASRRGDQVA